MSDPLSQLSRLEGIPSAVTATLDAIDAVLRDRGLRQIPAEESAKALHAGAVASATIADRTEPIQDSWQPAAVRLSTQLLDLAPLVRTSPGQVLARAHQVLARGIVDDELLGRQRHDREVADRMVALNGLLTAPTTASALVVAAVAHAEILTVQPFACGNGIVARAVERMVMIHGGVDPRAVVVCEEGHLAAGRGYDDAGDHYRSGTPAGVREWILHCVRAMAYGAEVSPLAKIPVRRQQGKARGRRT